MNLASAVRPRKKEPASFSEPQLIPVTGLEEYPFEFLLEKFYARIQKLEAEHDKVHGLMREYICTSALYLTYLSCFGSSALASHSIICRLRLIKPADFPDDFLVMHSHSRSHESKYFINRFNKELIKRIYLPHYSVEIRELVRFANLAEKDIITSHELDGDDE